MAPINPGNGAREALMDLGTAEIVDWLLAMLWTKGFKIVPLDADEIKLASDNIPSRK